MSQHRDITGKDEPDYKVKSAVLLIIYNRPEITVRVFEALRKAAPARLYVAADGPNESKEDDVVNCAAARNIIDKIDWECKLYTLFRDRNIGCKMGVISAINWFFEQEDEGIILEDDCVAASSFFRFCDELLDYYRYDYRIVTITGCNLQQGGQWGNASYYFSRISNVWGWATWKRYWGKYDGTLQRFQYLDIEKEMHKLFKDGFLAKAWIDNFNLVTQNKIDTWDYQLQFTTFFEHGLCATPNVNLISNIGFDSNATHTNNPQHSFHANLPLQPLNEIIHPVSFLPEDEADYFFLKKEYYLEEKWTQYHKDKLIRRRLKRWLRGLLNNKNDISKAPGK